MVECSAGDIVVLTGDWLDALNREREIAGDVDALRRDMARYAREREAYRQRATVRPEPVPERPPDGEIRELERVEPAGAELVEALVAYLDRNPRRSGETSSWLAVALWPTSTYPANPRPRQSRLRWLRRNCGRWRRETLDQRYRVRDRRIGRGSFCGAIPKGCGTP